MTKKIIIFFILFLISFLIILPTLVLADDWFEEGPPWEGEEATLWERMKYGLQPTEKIVYGIEGSVEIAPLYDSIMYLIRVFLSTLGIIFLIIVLYAGLRWMTAGGNEEKITEAKKLLINAAIGFIIIICALSITYFITYALIFSIRVKGE